MASASPLYRIEGLTKTYGEGDTAVQALRGPASGQGFAGRISATSASITGFGIWLDAALSRYTSGRPFTCCCKIGKSARTASQSARVRTELVRASGLLASRVSTEMTPSPVSQITLAQPARRDPERRRS